MKGLNLTDRIDEQIRGLGGKVKGLGLGRSGRYEQYIGAQAGSKLKTLKQVRDDVKGVDPSRIDKIADAKASHLTEIKKLGAQTKELKAGCSKLEGGKEPGEIA